MSIRRWLNRRTLVRLNPFGGRWKLIQAGEYLARVEGGLLWSEEAMLE